MERIAAFPSPSSSFMANLTTRDRPQQGFHYRDPNLNRISSMVVERGGGFLLKEVNSRVWRAVIVREYHNQRLTSMFKGTFVEPLASFHQG